MSTPLKFDEDEHQNYVDAKRRARMKTIDQQPKEVRVLVHEYGWSVVRACLDCGVSKPKHIKHLVETVLNEFSPTRGSYSSQGIRTELLNRRPIAGLET